MTTEQKINYLKNLPKGFVLYKTNKNIERKITLFSNGKLTFGFTAETGNYYQKAIPERAVRLAFNMPAKDITYHWLTTNFNVNPGSCVIKVLRSLKEMQF